MFWILVCIATTIKLMLIPSYSSTDFEVHRNWLAITSSLPLSQWYTDSTSQWTLDYPPLFAFFEYLLSYVAYYFDPRMLDVHNLNYKSPATLYFQRLSVIFTDLMLVYGVTECTNFLSKSNVVKPKKWTQGLKSPTVVFWILLIFNAGLFYVDHIHFQYNGFLFGVLLLSMAKILLGHFYEGAFWFAVLLNLKHIYIYIAPAYFIYLLRNHCFNPNKPASLSTFSMGKLCKLGAVVLSVFVVSFGPFIGQLPQVLSRLFPFDNRGLCHAYWAPNFWALYNSADKVAALIGKRFDFVSANVTGSLTRGLVENAPHVILPSVSPRACLLLTLLGVLPCCYKLWKCPGNPLHFVRCLVLCALSSFVFGWHVHEKAILLVIIPFTLLAVLWEQEARIFLLISTVGYFSLFPLLFRPFELPTKTLIFLVQCVYSFGNIAQLYREQVSTQLTRLPLLNTVESLYVYSFVFVYLFDTVLVHLFGLREKFPFLNLLVTSVYCSVGILYCYARYFYYFMRITSESYSHKKKVY